MHSPAWSQIGQSSGWLMRRNSIVAARELRTFSVVVLTESPSLSGVVQAAWIFGIPSISTRHIRHWPTTERRGW